MDLRSFKPSGSRAVKELICQCKKQALQLPAHVDIRISCYKNYLWWHLPAVISKYGLQKAKHGIIYSLVNLILLPVKLVSVANHQTTVLNDSENVKSDKW